MSEDSIGFRVTLRDVYNDVGELRRLVDQRLPAESPEPRIRKLEAQAAAQWIVVSIIIATVGALAAHALTR